MEETNLKNQKPGLNLRMLLIIILLVAVVLAAFLGVYRMITNIITNSNMHTMTELADHDRNSVQTTIDEFEDLNYNWALSVRTRRPQTIAELLTEVQIGNAICGFDRLSLVDEDLNFYRSNGEILRMEHYEEFLDDFGGRQSFIIRFNPEGIAHTAESRREYLVIFTKIREFSVDGVNFRYAVAEMPIKTFQDKLLIENYNGQGFSNIIDFDGYYVVNMNVESLWAKENFYNTYADAEVEGFENLQAFFDAVAAASEEENISATITYQGERYLLIASAMAGEDWYFVTMCRTSAFSTLSNQITGIFMVLLVVVLLAAVLTVMLIIRNSMAQKTATMETEHRKELSEALVLAQQSSRSKTAFLNNMSHDIRTPMNAIIGFTNLAKANSGDKSVVDDYLEKIGNASEHLLNLINDILDMSRIESGKVTLSEDTQNLRVVLDSIREIVQSDAEAKQLKLSVETEGIEHAYVVCDKLRLKQVLLNVISNALKYTNPGGSIWIKAAEKEFLREDNAAVYEFRVKDTGIGMSEEFVKTIFEAFTRETTSTLSGVSGTGLGMAITKNIIDMMDGSIEVNSKKGEGSEFIITLKFPLADEEELIRQKAAAEEEEEEEMDFTGRRILLVEDNELNREIAEEILTEVGFEVETAENGQLACDALAASEMGYFDLVLMDVQMPVMDGYEATRTIRRFENPHLAGIPIIAMTANAFEEDRKMAFDAGMDGHIAKPIDVEVLFTTLKEVFHNSSHK
ncbi:MAG: response regulator [Eubacteriales bacterium]|nr:response regulator [Eubacteriales bacterium]